MTKLTIVCGGFFIHDPFFGLPGCCRLRRLEAVTGERAGVRLRFESSLKRLICYGIRNCKHLAIPLKDFWREDMDGRVLGE
jgi:hypothetical protein